MTRRPPGALAIGPQVYLRHPTLGDGDGFLAAVRRSRALHHGRVTPPRDPRQFASYVESPRRGTLRYLVVRRDDAALVGTVSISGIVRSPFETGTLGYYAFTPHAGQGYMTEALALVLRQAFARAKLHRLEALIEADNRASIALVRRAGFHREGTARGAIKLGGRWRDLERFARLRG